MKWYGKIDNSRAWEYPFFIRFRGEGEIEESSQDLDALQEKFGVKIKATKEEKEESVNELEGFIASDSREILEEVQSVLEGMGWSLKNGL
ncbi:MAG: hypothetical protein ACLFRY_02205 [Spirochaetia bacterium]